MQCSKATRIALVALVAVGVSSLWGSAASQQTPKSGTPPKKERKRTRIGDVQVFYEKMQGKGDLSGFTISGPNTRIIVPDKISHSTLQLRADRIETRKEGKDVFGNADLTGNVRYTITQQTEDGERVLDGTAGHAFLRRAQNRVELTGGVQATFQDDARLKGPGTLKAARILVDIRATPYKYTLEGSPAVNDLEFTPLEDAPDKQVKEPKKPRVPVGTIHIHGYDSGEYQPGEIARFQGAQTTVNLDNAADKTHTRLQAPTFEATFTEDHAALARAEATGNARFTSSRPTPDGKHTQTLNGTSRRATYDAEKSDITLQNAIRATITNPDTLLKPANLRADHIVAHWDTEEKSYRYQITGAAQRTRLRFTPKPPADTKAKAALANPAPPQAGAPNPESRKFPIGDVEVKGFESSDYQPGKSLEIKGRQTVFDTADKKARTTTRFQAGHVVAAFADDSSLTHIEATGLQPAESVTFHAEQPSSALPKGAQKAAPPAVATMESFTGTAKKVTFSNAEDTNEIVVLGKFEAAVNDPENLAEPGHITGVDGDTLTLNLATTPYEFDMQSEKGTIVIEFQPRDKSQDESKAKPLPKEPKSKPKSPAKPEAKGKAGGKNKNLPSGG